MSNGNARNSGCAEPQEVLGVLPAVGQRRVWLANSEEQQISIAGFNFEGYEPQFPVPRAL